MARVTDEIAGSGAPGAAAASYDAFISYSQRGDKAIAGALRTVIQTIGKPWWKLRSLSVFLDAASLSAAPGLWESLAGKLDRSRYLILLASPESAASPWVDKEVAHFIREGGPGVARLLIGLTAGELAWDAGAGDFRCSEATPLPACLRGRFREEPLWVDLRAFRSEPARATKSDQAFLHAALDLAATIKGVEKADLYSEELRQQRRSLRIAYGAAGLVGVLGVGAAVGAWIAVQRANEATRNFAIARETVDKVVTEIMRDLRNVEGIRVEAVGKILETTQGALNLLFTFSPGDPEILASNATTMIEIGDTYVAKGDSAGALKVFDQSLEIRRKLAAGSNDPKRLAAVSQAISRVGYARYNKGDIAGAESAFDESLAILARIMQASPSDADLQDRLAWDVMKKGDIRVTQGRAAEGIAFMERAAGIWRNGIAVNPDWRPELAGVLTRLARAHLALANRDAAGQALSESLGLWRAESAADGSNSDAKYRLALVLVDIADLRRSAGDDVGTRSAIAEAEEILERLARIDGANVFWNGSLADILVERGILDRASGRSQESWEAFNQAEGIYRRLAAIDRGTISWRGSLSGVLFRLGHMKLAAGAGGEALADFEESVALRRAIVEETGRAASWRAYLASGLGALGYARSKVHGTDAGSSAYEEAATIYRGLVNEQPLNSDWQLELATILDGLGDAKQEAEALEEAKAYYKEALGLRQALVDRDPANVEWQSALAGSYANLGDLCRAAKDFEGALANYQRAVELERKAVAAAPEKEYMRASLAFYLEKVAERKRGLGDKAGAEAAYREAIALREKFTDHANVARVVDLARARLNLQGLLTDPEERLDLLQAVVDDLSDLEDNGRLTDEGSGLLDNARAEMDRVLKLLPQAQDEKSPADASTGDKGDGPGD